MRIVHDPDGAAIPLATEVDRAETMLEQARGLMFRLSIPDDYALVFPFDDVAQRFIHMLFVAFALDVVWLADDEVQQVATMYPWRSFAYGRADTVIELPAGGADSVREGDVVVIES